MDATARATILNRLFYFNAGRYLSAVDFKEDQLQRYIVIDESVILRAKLLNDRLEWRNYPTLHASQWVQQLALEGLPPISRLHFGYRLDVTGTVVRDAFVTLPNGNPVAVNDWVWQVYGEPVREFGIQQPLLGREVYRYDSFAV